MKTVTVFHPPIPCAILENGAATTMTKRDPSFTAFLGFVAMRRSLHAAKEYAGLSRIVVPEEQKSLFSDMAAIKRNEYACIQLYPLADWIISPESKNQLPPSRCHGDTEKRSFVSMEDACRFILSKEMNNYVLYLRLADQEEEVTIKRLFLFLARMHRICLNYIQNIVQFHVLAGMK
jgi:hypothetical protein